MPIAQIIRAHANTFYVLLEGREFACQPRGKFRLTETTVRVGDAVEVTPLAAGEGRIERVLPRRNELTRPPIANVDQAALVFTGATRTRARCCWTASWCTPSAPASAC